MGRDKIKHIMVEILSTHFGKGEREREREREREGDQSCPLYIFFRTLAKFIELINFPD